MFQKILVAIDGSPGSDKALAEAVDLAERCQAELAAVSVAEVPEVVAMMDEVDEIRETAETCSRKVGEAAAAYAHARGVRLRFMVLRGHAADAILRYAEAEGIDLIVVGQHGHSAIARFFLGSTSDRISHHAACNVLIVK